MGLRKFLEAKELLESVGLEVVNESTSDEIVATVRIHYENTTTADERTKEGRHTFHRLKGAYGIHESEDGTELIGGKRIGMFTNKTEKRNFAWTWIDVSKFLNLVIEKYGVNDLSVSEQHGQAVVHKEANDEPVSTGDFSQDGPYGAGSASVWYFTMTIDRTWQIKISGDPESIAKIRADENLKESFEDIAKRSMPAWVKVQEMKADPSKYIEFSSHQIPDVYNIDVTIK